jgi:hypothetical protein
MNAIEQITLFVMLAAAMGNSGCRSGPTTVPDHTQVRPEAIAVLSWLPPDSETFIAYRNLSPGVAASSYDLSRSHPLSWFFVFMAQLGHAVYV